MRLENEKTTEFYNIKLSEPKTVGEVTISNAALAFTSNEGLAFKVAVPGENGQPPQDDSASDKPAVDDKPKEGEEAKKEGKEEPDEKKEADKGEQNPDATQAPVEQGNQVHLDISQINAAAATEAKLLMLGGHDSNLDWRPYGLPIGEDSVPRDLNIAWDFLGVVQLTAPLVKPPAPAPEAEGPCCSNIILINTDSCGLSATAIDSPLEQILNNSFKFVFEYFCDTNTGHIIFTQTGGGVYSSEGEISAISSYTPETFIIDINQDCEYCPPINCDNPIVSIRFSMGDAENYIIPCIDYFNYFISYQQPYDVTFLDSFGNSWGLVNNKENFELHCVTCLQGTAPIVIDLNHDGFDLISPTNSQIKLPVDGKEVASGWVGPNDGLLTFGYSGSGPIESKNFVLTENVPGAKTDLQALETLAGKNSGLIDNSNPIWDKLGVWQDANQNAKVDQGEYHSLTELKITSISLDEQGSPQLVNGNIINSVISFNYADGTSGKAADVTLKYEDVVQNNQNVVELNSPASSSPQSSPSAQPVVAEAGPVAPPHTDPAVQAAIDTSQHQPVPVAA